MKDEKEPLAATAEALDDSSEGVSVAARVFLVVRDAAGARVEDVVDGATLVVGRDPEADVRLDGAAISRRHARIDRRGGELLLTDLGSRNGTRVGDDAARLRSESRPLRAGDVIRVGDAEIVVASSQAVAPRAEATAAALDDDDDARGAANIAIGDAAMRKVWETARKLARVPTTVLLVGETGVGKEVVAERIHAWGAHARSPLVRLNCAALPETLLESALFGHEKGAFTGATQRKIGFLEAAGEGTVFLDEIGEMPLAMQAKLLRVLESRKFVRLGGTQETAVRARIVSATHRDVRAMIASGAFREDLYFRISTFTLKIPPLRERTTEIAILADRFADEQAARLGAPRARLTSQAIEALTRYAWPGNVRELRNAIEHAVVMADGGEILPEHLPEDVTRQPNAPSASPSPAASGSMPARVETIERESIQAALASENGNKTRAARRLGIPRHVLLYKLAKYGL